MWRIFIFEFSKDITSRDGKKISVTTFDFLKFSKQLTERKLCGNFQKSQEKVVRFVSVKILMNKFTVVSNQVVNRLLDENTVVHCSFGEHNFEHILKNVSNGTNEVHRQS